MLNPDDFQIDRTNSIGSDRALNTLLTVHPIGRRQSLDQQSQQSQYDTMLENQIQFQNVLMKDQTEQIELKS